jgi:Iap family predicted aminopeptidase
MPRRATWNLVAETGDPDAERTVVIMAHHDAPKAGLVFHQGPQRWLDEHTPVVQATDTSVPLWLVVAGAPLLVALGALLRRTRPLVAGTVVSAGSAAAMADIAFRHPVPAANDNASGVAVLVALAEALEREPVSGLRVLLVSCGSEESLQQGMRAWGRRWFGALPRDRTWFLNMETVGSPELVLLEGEGTLWMEEYPDDFKELVANWAAEEGVTLRRNLRSSFSTDGVVPMRAGYPTATFVSVTRWKSLANYHWPSDIPENVDYGTVEQALIAAEGVVRRLASSKLDAAF